MKGKPTSASRITTYHMTLPLESNNEGNLFGGCTMRLMDEVGFFSAMRHARRRLVAAAMSISFRAPVRMGEIVICHASVNAVWNTSMEVGIRTEAEDPMTGEVRHVCTCYIVYVGVDNSGRPRPLPPLIPETDEDRRRVADATRRMAMSRLEQKRENAPMSALRLELLSGEYTVCRLPKKDSLPDFSALPASSFLSVSDTEDELSLMLDEEAANVLGMKYPDMEMAEGYRCLKVAESDTIRKIGMLASLTTLLASSQVPVLTVSTYTTFYVLVETAMLDKVLDRLRSAGHLVNT